MYHSLPLKLPGLRFPKASCVKPKLIVSPLVSMGGNFLPAHNVHSFIAWMAGART